MANKWVYECDCKNCSMIQFVNDPEHHRHGDYCMAAISGKRTVHADDDFVVRCYCYTPKFEQASLFNA